MMNLQSENQKITMKFTRNTMSSPIKIKMKKSSQKVSYKNISIMPNTWNLSYQKLLVKLLQENGSDFVLWILKKKLEMQ